MACDGTVQVHGDGDRAERLRYRFKRRVDYGSAACLLIRREAFTTVGGFERHHYRPRVLPAVVNLAMRLSRIGLATVYQPRSTVTHVRYGSGGQDQAAELSERNRRTFAERWRAELGRPVRHGVSDQAAIAARDVNATPRVLTCTNVLETTVVPLIRSLVTSWPMPDNLGDPDENNG